MSNMSDKQRALKQIKNLSVDELAEALEENGYAEASKVIHAKAIDGTEFLNLTEGQLAFWRTHIPQAQARRLWSFVQRIKEHPDEFTLKSQPIPIVMAKTHTPHKPAINTPVVPQTSYLYQHHIVTEQLKGTLTKVGSVNNNSDAENNNRPMRKQLPLPHETSPSNFPEHPDNALEDYLTPIVRETKQNQDEILRSRPNAGTFLRSKFQKGRFENIETRVKVEENKYVTQTHVNYNRPLPPVPLPAKPNSEPTRFQQNEKENSEEILPEYIEIEEEKKKTLFKNPLLPPTDSSDSNALANRSLPKPPSFLPLVPSNLSTSPTKVFPESPPPYKPKMPTPPIPVPQVQANKFVPGTNFNVLKRNSGEAHITSTTEPPEEENIGDYAEVVDFTRESYYHNINRQESRRLLQSYEDGAFIVRPSRRAEFVCTISVQYMSKMYNIGVENGPNNSFQCNSVSTTHPTFHTVSDLINYYYREPLSVINDNNEIRSILLKNVVRRN